MAFGPDGQLYVSSYNNDKILRFDGTTGGVFADDGVGGLDQPEYLAFTPAHQVTVSAPANTPPVKTIIFFAAGVAVYFETVSVMQTKQSDHQMGHGMVMKICT